MLTDSQVKKAVSSARVDAILNDGASEKGGGSLRLKIRPGKRGTTATWFAWWQENGKPKTITLGRYPEVSLASARILATKSVADAKNPAPAQVDPSDRTVEKLFAGYVGGMRKDGKSSADEVEGRLARAMDTLGKDTPAGDIGPADIAGVLKPIYDRGARVMADRMRAYLSAAFSWGIEAAHDYTAKTRIDWGIKANPAAMVRRDTAANTTRERNLSADELATLWAAMDGAGFADGTGAAIRLLICCGQRVRETMRLEGRDIDLDAGLWTMAAAKTKGGQRSHAVPLPAQALPILRQLKARHGDGWLFPARCGESDLQLASSVGKAIRRWLVDSEAERFQARDLRRTWKSRAGDAGVDRFTRDLIQQHAKGDTGSKHYDRTDYLPQMRQGMTIWENWLETNVVKTQQHKAAA